VRDGPTISIIAAVAENRVIGSDGKMPWRLSTDMKRFKRLTMGKPVVMGRKTFESIGKPLAGRPNVVVTRQPGFQPEGATVAPNLDAALALAAERQEDGEVIVAGGGEIYAAAIGLAERLYITHVEARPEGDTRFPDIDPAIWRATATETVPAGEKDSAATRFVIYERVGNRASPS